MKRTLLVTLAIACGVFALADYFVAQPVIDRVGGVLFEGVVVLGAFALLAGLLNLLVVHTRQAFGDLSARAQGEGRAGSLLLLVALFGTLTIGVVLPGGTLGWLFAYVYHPLQATLAALLAFYVVSAVYRMASIPGSGRRATETAILLGAALFALILQMPFIGGLSPYLALLRDWFMAVPVTAGARGMILGIALGTVATSLRVLLAVDRPYASE
jgi:hypothetical protein